MQPEPLTITGQANDHRTSTMKVDPDILSIHRGLPSSEEDTVVRSPESPTGTRNLHEERRPRPFIASVMRPADRMVDTRTAGRWSEPLAQRYTTEGLRSVPGRATRLRLARPNLARAERPLPLGRSGSTGSRPETRRPGTSGPEVGRPRS